VVLAHGLAARAGRFDLVLSIAHVNHGLRGAQSDAEESFVADYAKRLGVPFASGRVDPRGRRAGAVSSRVRPTLQEAARRARADALRVLAAELGAAHVATAHTADDQAETVLLRLFRGSGPEGLGGIAEASADGFFVRPLLRATRAQVLSYARRQALTWCEDPSNTDARYARARLRHGWLPGLAREFNPALLRAIGDLAEAQRRETEWTAGWVETEARRRFALQPDGSMRVAASGWDLAETPDALARRLARIALHRMGASRDVSRAHLDRIVRFWRAGRRGSAIELPGSLVLSRDRQGFRLARRLPPGHGC
jgi:tRNA(Ile)-lysidine synthase